MIGGLRDPNVAVAALLGGLAIGSVEFLRPGWVVPGVAGATLLMLGIAGLWEQPLNRMAVVLLVGAVFVAGMDAIRHWGGAAACASAILTAIALRWLISPPGLPVHWGIAGLGGALLLGGWRLAAFAVQAKLNKMS